MGLRNASFGRAVSQNRGGRRRRPADTPPGGLSAGDSTRSSGTDAGYLSEAHIQLAEKDWHKMCKRCCTIMIENLVDAVVLRFFSMVYSSAVFFLKMRAGK